MSIHQRQFLSNFKVNKTGIKGVMNNIIISVNLCDKLAACQ